MKFRVEYDLDSVEDVIPVGEWLRRRFFDEKMLPDGYRTYGCYSEFDVKDDVVELPQVPVSWPDEDWPSDLMWKCYSLELPEGTVYLRWYWDGDGILEFQLPDGTVFHNGDCKKDYEWETRPNWGPSEPYKPFVVDGVWSSWESRGEAE